MKFNCKSRNGELRTGKCGEIAERNLPRSYPKRRKRSGKQRKEGERLKMVHRIETQSVRFVLSVLREIRK